ncbi:helix-turn-helix transcriptional regulator [Streptomyces sp. NPDC001941]|uniref:helix-turn-helix transcriptional regulator n=1 Tax=Streptomyces sp. NPDC001941 TaxID=3154659 RepID=UPI0033174495
MPQWSEYSTGERIAIMRGATLTQESLAELTGVSVQTIRNAEQDKTLTLPTLLKIAGALHTRTSVILGEEAPVRSMGLDDRKVLVRLSNTVHDVSAGLLPTDLDPVTVAELDSLVRHAWQRYWDGEYGEVGGFAVQLLRQAAVTLHALPDGEQAAGHAVMSDAFRIAAYVANLWGARDLAYAGIGHAAQAARKAADPLRDALVASGRAWVYLRDARLDDALALAEKAAVDIEPVRGRTATRDEWTVYGSHVNFAAVVASRMERSDLAHTFLGESNMAGARMGAEHGAFGTLHGPTSAAVQAVGINVSLGEISKASDLVDSLNRRQLSQLQEAAQRRYEMDLAQVLVAKSNYDAALSVIHDAVTASPNWAAHQTLPSVIVRRAGRLSTNRLRTVANLVGVRPIEGAPSFDPATLKSAL